MFKSCILIWLLIGRVYKSIKWRIPSSKSDNSSGDGTCTPPPDDLPWWIFPTPRLRLPFLWGLLRLPPPPCSLLLWCPTTTPNAYAIALPSVAHSTYYIDCSLPTEVQNNPKTPSPKNYAETGDLRQRQVTPTLHCKFFQTPQTRFLQTLRDDFSRRYQSRLC